MLTSKERVAIGGGPTRPSVAVRARLDLVMPVACDAASRLCEHPDLALLYPELLHIEHAALRASVPLLRTAEAQAVRRRADPVAAGLVDFLRRHANEKLHHDDLVLEDYQALGRDSEEILRRPPSSRVAAMVGAIYYWILHCHPVAILGYLAVMEASPPTRELVSELQRRSGHPLEAFSTLAHHAAVDADVPAELWSVLDRLPLTPDHLDLVCTAALHTVDLHIAAIDELLTDSDASAW